MPQNRPCQLPVPQGPPPRSAARHRFGSHIRSVSRDERSRTRSASGWREGARFSDFLQVFRKDACGQHVLMAGERRTQSLRQNAACCLFSLGWSLGVSQGNGHGVPRDHRIRELVVGVCVCVCVDMDVNGRRVGERRRSRNG